METIKNIFEFLDNYSYYPNSLRTKVNKNYISIFNNYIVLKKIV